MLDCEGGLAHAVAQVLSRGVASYQPGLAEAAARASWQSYARTLHSFLHAVQG